MNTLYYGDNLNVLREHVPDESVDLIYLDPPFNSKRDYNILYREPMGGSSSAQITAFEDTWHWTDEAERAYQEITDTAPPALVEMMQSFRRFIGVNDMMAYLTMMAIRLIELRRVLKPTGSIYLHCDPTASHYLKILLDAVFGKANFRNEISWRRSHPKGHAFTRFANNHDVIFSYAKDSHKVLWNQSYKVHDPEKIKSQYTLKDESGRLYQLTSLLNPNPNRPNLTYKFKGVTRVWRWTKERMQAEDDKGNIVVPRGGSGIPRYKRYLDEQEGVPIGDFWEDVELVSGGEKLGFPTQKPVALLERIIQASSNAGDVVLDPFCGCGTTIVAAQKLKRKWVGIDITHLAISLIENRLREHFPRAKFEVLGTPKDLEGARDLADRDKHQFEWWALSLVGARPYGDKKKGGDTGIDGIMYFRVSPTETVKVVVSVKGGGNINPGMVRDLKGVMEREKAGMGVFITLEPPTAGMKKEAAAAGVYKHPLNDLTYPKLQMFTIEELLDGTKLKAPAQAETFKKASIIDTIKQQGFDL